MKKLNHYCENCDSTFQILYEEDKVGDDPHFCPICSEYIIEDSEEADDMDL